MPPVRVTKDDIYDIGGIQFMDREIASDVNGVARKMRKAARLSAQAAEKSLKEDLAPHQRSKQLYRSIQSVVIKETTNVYSASTSVGLDVEHSIYFFEDTRDGVSKLYGPTGKKRGKSDGRGPAYLQTFSGYKGHEEYIERAQRKANSVIRSEVRNINRGLK